MSNLQAVEFTFGVYQTDKASVVYKKFKPVVKGLQRRLESTLGENVRLKMRIFKSYDKARVALINRDIDFARLPHGRRIALKMRQVTAPYGAVTGGPLLRELGNALADSEALGLAHVGQHVGVVLLVDIAKVEVHGRRVSIQGWLLLQNQAGEDLVDSVGERLMRRRFRIDDMESVATLRSEAVAVVRELESAMARQQ